MSEQPSEKLARAARRASIHNLREDLAAQAYQLGVKYFERIGEHGDILQGNGHHMAQSLVTAALDIWDGHLKQKHRP